MKNPVYLTILITLPIIVGALVYDQRARLFPPDPGPLIKPVDAVLDDSWDLEKLGGTVADPRQELPPPEPRPQRELPPDQPPLPAEPVLYYGKTCPHCQKLLEFVQTERIAEKTGLREKEVYNNEENAREAVRAATSCGVPEAKMAVPFLFADGQCLFGEPEAMAWMKARAGLN